MLSPKSCNDSACAMANRTPLTTTARPGPTHPPHRPKIRASARSTTPRKNSSSKNGAPTTVAIPITRYPIPCEFPVSRWAGASNRWWKSWMCGAIGMYTRAIRYWPATPIGIPIRSIHRNRRPRSAQKCLDPRSRLASTAAARNPPHSPNSVEMTNQVGGSASLDNAPSEWACPARAAAAPTVTAASNWPPRNPRHA